MTRAPKRDVTLLAAAKDDIGRLQEDDPALAKLALRKLGDLRNGSATGKPLAEMAKAGDLSDCHKLYFGTGDPPSHRIVYRVIDGDQPRIEVLEVVAVESRDDMYVYLLAATRLGRLPKETKKTYDRLHQAIIGRRGDRRGQRS